MESTDKVCLVFIAFFPICLAGKSSQRPNAAPANKHQRQLRKLLSSLKMFISTVGIFRIKMPNNYKMFLGFTDKR